MNPKRTKTAEVFAFPLSMLSTAVNILYGVFLVYCALSVLYLFIFAIAGKALYRKKFANQSATYKRIAILVPSYKEDGIILSTADHLLLQEYPRDHFDVFIIADSFQEETLTTLSSMPVKLIKVSFEKSTKTRSLNEAFSRINESYDIALISDADNILAPDFLQKINAAFAGGAQVVQGCRVAKNLDSSFAILDACSEGINNHIFRKGANGLGLSSSIIGSGMAYDFALVKQLLSEIHAVGGFDKILQLKVVQKKIHIYYLEDALAFDEKVDNSQAFKKQRNRWVSSQFIYLKKFFFPAFGQLFKGNLSYFNLAVANNLILPRAFLFILMPVLVAVSFLMSTYWGIIALVIWGVYVFTLAISLPSRLVNKDLLRAIGSIPRAIFLMLGTLLHLRKANKTFIHTVHTKTEVTSNYLMKGNK